jgi:hypothetical protein
VFYAMAQKGRQVLKMAVAATDTTIDFIVRTSAGLTAIVCAIRCVQAAQSIIHRKPLIGVYWWGPIVGIFGLEMAGVALNVPGPLTYLLARLLP